MRYWLESCGLNRRVRWLGWLLLGILLVTPCVSWAQTVGLPTLDINVGQATNPQEVSKGLQILILLTVLTLAPAILVMTTAFTRIVIVLSLVRHALGSPTLPPNQVIVGLALILTFFVMAPTFGQINEKALQPYLASKLPQQEALTQAITPIRTFMFRQVNEEDVALFVRLAKLKAPKTTDDVPTHVLLPAFVISELKTAFQLGFMVFLPFLVIDIVVSSILVSMGMLFLPPMSISMPFKLVLFVLVDGWHLITEALVMGFHAS
jgi:flagellar biosynthetic protein FliP